MKAFETRVLSAPENQNDQQADGKGAQVRNLDSVLIAVYKQVFKDASSGGRATAGTEDDRHSVCMTGDGCGATADESACGLRAFAGSVNKSNQSVNGIRNLAAWRGTSVEDWDTVLLRISSFRKRLCEIWRDGRLKLPNGDYLTHPETDDPVYFRFVLTRDKPFMCHVLGRQNMNADSFSFQCDCLDPRNELHKLDSDPMTHYTNISFQKRCGRALVALWGALEEPEPEDWEIYDDIREKVIKKYH